jgi:hypothetical protein
VGAAASLAALCGAVEGSELGGGGCVASFRRLCCFGPFLGFLSGEDRRRPPRSANTLYGFVVQLLQLLFTFAQVVALGN